LSTRPVIVAGVFFVCSYDTVPLPYSIQNIHPTCIRPPSAPTHASAHMHAHIQFLATIMAWLAFLITADLFGGWILAATALYWTLFMIGIVISTKA
jgi:hypothetical protein